MTAEDSGAARHAQQGRQAAAVELIWWPIAVLPIYTLILCIISVCTCGECAAKQSESYLLASSYEALALRL